MLLRHKLPLAHREQVPQRIIKRHVSGVSALGGLSQDYVWPIQIHFIGTSMHEVHVEEMLGTQETAITERSACVSSISVFTLHVIEFSLVSTLRMTSTCRRVASSAPWRRSAAVVVGIDTPAAST
jgi:hypothetical protein